MRRKNLRIAGLRAIAGVVVLAAAAAASASTGTVKLDYLGSSPRQAAKIWLGGTYQGTYLTGQYNLEMDETYDPDGNALPGEGFEGEDLYAAFEPDYALGTFCADIRQDVPSGSAVYEVYRPQDAPIGGENSPDGMGETKATHLRQLFQYVLQDELGVGPDTSTTLSADNAAAFQAAVWEVIHETDTSSYDVGSGYVQMEERWETGWLDTSNTWLGWLSTEEWDDPDIGLRVLANETEQDYALTIPGLGANPIPEPLTVLGVLAGAAGIGAYLRKRRSAQEG